MDGTLTLPVHDFAQIRQQLGLEKGTPILEAIMQMSPPQATATHKRLHQIEMEMAALAVAQPGVEDALEKIKIKGCKLGILTRNHEQIAAATLKASGLDGLFAPENVIGRETCAPKPLPDGINYLLAQWMVKDCNAVMVGDYRYDIEAGRRAGIKTIHFDSNGNFEWPQLADYKVKRIRDIVALMGD